MLIYLLGGRRVSASYIMWWLWLGFMHSDLLKLPGACEVTWIEVYVSGHEVASCTVFDKAKRPGLAVVILQSEWRGLELLGRNPTKCVCVI